MLPQAIRDHPIYGRSVIVLIIEANMSYIGADLVAGWLRRVDLRPVYILSRDPTPKARVGVWTGENEKVLYAAEMERVLANHTLRRAAELIDHPRALPRWDQLVQQMAMFRRTVKNPADEVFQSVKVAFSGKGGGNADDLCLALQMALYWGNDVRRDTSFLQMAGAYGWNIHT